MDNPNLTVGVPKEMFAGERRVTFVPSVLPPLIKGGVSVLIESGAGLGAAITDDSFKEKGATIVASREEVFEKADIIAQVRLLGANPKAGKTDLDHYRRGQLVIGFCDPLGAPEAIKTLADTGVNVMAMETIPRITRAQSMDALSSMATVAGYKAVLLAAEALPRFFPMFMTAAGTIAPARVFVIGAGVAGLQAIATAKRLGAVVSAYDVRPAVREQVESLGAKFTEMELETGDAEDKGGYAKAMGEDFYQKQREFMTRIVADQDVVITTAAIPGKKAPILITEEMVKGMQTGAVIVDLAAERGGNCELSEPDQRVEKYDTTILGPTNLPSTVPFHASQMYGKNVATLLQHLIKDGKLELNMDDEITRETMVAKDGEVTHARVRELLGLEAERKEG